MAVSATASSVSSTDLTNFEVEMQKLLYKIGKEISIIGAMTLSGYVAAGLFTAINPLGGAVFGLSTALADGIAGFSLDKMGITQSIEQWSTAAKVAVHVGIYIACAAAGAAVTMLLGFPFTLAATVTLTATTLLTALGITLLAYPICVEVSQRLAADKASNSTASTV